MAKDKKDKAAKKAQGKEPKEIKKARTQWRMMEDQIDTEFRMLVKDGFPMEELETLRWDYRYAKLEEYTLSQELLEYFVAEADAKHANLPPPPMPGAPAQALDARAPIAAQLAGVTGPDYQRKSQVDLDLVEKYLDRKVGRETRSEMESLYKEAFGEDLMVPQKIDLVDISYHADVTGADAARKLSKSEILGVPDDSKPEEKRAEEAKVQAAPVAKGESRALAVALAWKKGVPTRPTRDEKWSPLFPFKFWLIPKRFAGQSVAVYYVLLLINLIIFMATIIPFAIPFMIRGFFWLVVYLYRRFVKQRVGPAMAKIKEKTQIPQTPPAEAKKETAPAKSS